MSLRPWELAPGTAEVLSRSGGTKPRKSSGSASRAPRNLSAAQQRRGGHAVWDHRNRSATQQVRGGSTFRIPSNRSAVQQHHVFVDAIERFVAEHPLLGELEAAGVQLRRVGRTNGGEWAGPCPLCGGRDRLRAWPSPSKGHPRAWCRQCKRTGDALAWATLLAGRDPKVRGSAAATLRERGYLEEVRRG